MALLRSLAVSDARATFAGNFEIGLQAHPMFRYLTRAARHAVGLHRPGFRLPVREDDILLALYPTSDDRRTRFLIANIVFPDEEIGYGDLHRFVLDCEVTVKREFDRAPRPRIIQSHASFDPRYRRVIYMVRDPREVALAQYYNLLKLHRIDPTSSMAEFVELFLSRDLYGFAGSWGEHVGSWLATRMNHPGFLLIRYEDMLQDPSRELARTGTHSFSAIGTARWRQARSTLSNMTS